MAEQENIITVKNLLKQYKTYKRGTSFKDNIKSFFNREKILITAVNGITMQVKKGSITGILGPNGAGKSTLIKMMTGTLFPTSGELEVLGFNPTKNRKTYVHNIGAVFGQKSQLIWDIPPEDSFMMNAAIYNIPEKEYKDRVQQMTEMFELGDCIHKPTRVLSLGERMKCEFIMAMLHDPQVVFLDEPTIGLDVIAKQRIRAFIMQMNKKGTTFILTTHDLEDVEQLAQEVIIINHGTKVFDGSLSQLRHTLGEKKLLTLTLDHSDESVLNEINDAIKSTNSSNTKTIDALSIIPGIKVTGTPSPYEIELEADISVIHITDLLNKIAECCDFTDISIKELPMETIITKIYTDD